MMVEYTRGMYIHTRGVKTRLANTMKRVVAAARQAADIIRET